VLTGDRVEGCLVDETRAVGKRGGGGGGGGWVVAEGGSESRSRARARAESRRVSGRGAVPRSRIADRRPPGGGPPQCPATAFFPPLPRAHSSRRPSVLNPTDEQVRSHADGPQRSAAHELASRRPRSGPIVSLSNELRSPRPRAPAPRCGPLSSSADEQPSLRSSTSRAIRHENNKQNRSGSGPPDRLAPSLGTDQGHRPPPPGRQRRAPPHCADTRRVSPCRGRVKHVRPRHRLASRRSPQPRCRTCSRWVEPLKLGCVPRARVSPISTRSIAPPARRRRAADAVGNRPPRRPLRRRPVFIPPHRRARRSADAGPVVRRQPTTRFRWAALGAAARKKSVRPKPGPVLVLLVLSFRAR